MAIASATTADRISRPCTFDATQDWTYRLSVYFNGVVAGDRNLLIFDDAGAYTTPWVTAGIVGGTANFLFSADGGSGEVDSTPTAVSINAWLHLYLLYNATSHMLQCLLNEVSMGTLAVTFAAPFVDEILFNDSVTAGNTSCSIAYARVWQGILSAGQRAAEDASTIAVRTTNLLSDTPLQAGIDLTAHNNTLTPWTATGTITTDTNDPLISVLAGPPTNTAAGTALMLTSSSAAYWNTLTAGAATTVWGKAVATQTVHGIAGFGDLVTYKPSVTVYDGLANALANTPIPNYGTPVPNGPVQFPATIGNTYYFQFARNGAVTPATLIVSFLDALRLSAPAGSIAVNDVTDQFPLAILDVSTAAPLTFVSPFPAGELGVILPSGVLAVQDATADTITLYTATYGLIAAVDTSALSGLALACNSVDLFYLGDNGGAGDATVRTITTAGVLSAVRWTLTGSGQVTILCPTRDNTILYYLDSSAVNQPIKRWDLVNNVALSNLVAGLANYAITHEILVLADGTLIVRYIKQSATKDQKILHYSAAGAVLGTYDYGADFGTQDDRMFSAIDDPVSFWFWVRPATLASAGKSTFKNITVATMTVATTRDGPMFDNGITDNSPIATNTPARWGFSESCPAWVTRGSTPVPPSTQVYPIRRQRRFLLPSSDSNHLMQIPTIELLMRTGIGLKPDAWDTDFNEPFGANPKVMFRLSKDGGETWGPERTVTAGEIGQYLRRLRLLQATGNYRNAVLEVTVDAPVDWQFLAALAPSIVEGSS